MGRILFIVFALVVWVGGHAYLGHRLIVASLLTRRARLVAWLTLSVAALLPIVVLSLGRNGVTFVGERALHFVAFTAFGVSSVLFVFVFVVDVARLLLRGVARVAAAKGAPDNPDRRAFIGRVLNAGAVGATGVMAPYGYSQVRGVPGVVEVDVEIDALPPNLEGFRIAQVTDIHVGPTIRGDDLRAIVARVNELDADIVAVTGDLVDGHVEELRTQVEPLASVSARHGAFFVTGNHEYYWDAPAWCSEIRRLGLTVLNNEHRVIEVGSARLLLAGVTDVRSDEYVPDHTSDPAAARAGAPPCDVDVLLAHQPRSIYAAAEAGFDLQISGHTHGGQYFPMTVLIHLVQPYVSGLHRHGRTQIYVSCGTGYWGPPLRVGAPPEITLIRLRRR